jgi:hypothetical protein
MTGLKMKLQKLKPKLKPEAKLKRKPSLLSFKQRQCLQLKPSLKKLES